jgi:hypothetical protein
MPDLSDARPDFPGILEHVERLTRAKEQAYALYQSARHELDLILRERHSKRQYATPDDILLRAKDSEEFYFQVYSAAVHNLNQYVSTSSCKHPETKPRLERSITDS